MLARGPGNALPAQMHVPKVLFGALEIRLTCGMTCYLGQNAQTTTKAKPGGKEGRVVTRVFGSTNSRQFSNLQIF